MEGNKDESNKCILIATRFIEQQSYEKAVKYLNKAERLYPSQRAKDLLQRVESLINGDSNGGTDSNKNSSEGVRQRKGSFGRKKSEEKSDQDVKEQDYTDDQIAAVKRIKKCKDYYEILGVEKTCTENDLKKAYRKLALQMHPDKNKAPGSTEAFKAIGNAFSVLNDAEKRKKYDMFGPEEEQRRSSQRGYEYDYSHGFEGDISPEELFNMFFGGNFPTGSVYTRRARHPHSHRHFSYSRESHSNDGSATLLLQLAPILLLVFLSLLSSFFVSDPLYSLQRSDRYSSQRKTSNLRVPYFVKSDFTSNFAGDVRRIERQVEDEYVSNLRANCWRERSYKENMLWKARNYADAKLYERAQDMETPSCEQLQRLYG